MVWVGEIDWNDDSVEHIARHGVEPAEVEQVVFGEAFATRGRGQTHRFIGQTDSGRYLTVIVARRKGPVFGVVTARDATLQERRALRNR